MPPNPNVASSADLSAYRALSERAAALVADDDMTFTGTDFPEVLADHTPFDRLVIDNSFISEIGWGGEGDLPFEVIHRSRGFEAYAEREGFRRLGLWMLHLLFSGREWAGLELTHSTSRVQCLYVRILRPLPGVFGLQTDGPQPYTSFEYWPQEVWRHPFAGPSMNRVRRVRKKDRPLFAFGWSREMMAHQFDVSRAAQVIVEATPKGVAAIAELLMDIANPTLGLEQVDMEPPGIGFAATQIGSIHARFYLPNSVAFYCDTLDQLRLCRPSDLAPDRYRD